MNDASTGSELSQAREAALHFPQLCDVQGQHTTTLQPTGLQPSKIEKLDQLLSKSCLYSEFISGHITTDVGNDKLAEPALLKGTLYPYQAYGCAWLTSLYQNGVNGILADEMGLGKTVQVIAFFAALYEHRVVGPHLVVAPLSTLSNWAEELKKWCPLLPVTLYHGTKEERRALRATIASQCGSHISHKRKRDVEELSRQGIGGVVITSYNVLLRDSSILRNQKHYQWGVLVVDEGHRLKNYNCELICELKKISLFCSNIIDRNATPKQPLRIVVNTQFYPS